MRYPLAINVHQAEVMLRPGIALLRSFPVPAHCLLEVMWHSMALVLVHRVEVTLRFGIALLRTLHEPAQRLL